VATSDIGAAGSIEFCISEFKRRIMATDNENSVEPDFDSAAARVAMRRRHLQIGLRMQAIATYALEELERKIATGEPLGLSAEDAKKLLAAGEKLEREAIRSRGNEEPVLLKKPN
jgi:hypothetical protein